MDPAQRLWDFIARCEAAATGDEVSAAFLEETAQLGFPYVALVSHIGPDNPPPDAVLVYRYPAAWVERFREQGYETDDPVYAAASQRSQAFSWGDGRFLARLSRKQRAILNEGAEAGVANGTTLPIKSEEALPASCSLVPDACGVSAENVRLAQKMAVFAYDRLRQIKVADSLTMAPRLTARERECLLLAARGKSDWAISTMLGVSEGAINRTIERAKRRLGVATRTQAVLHALRAGEFSLYDVA